MGLDLGITHDLPRRLMPRTIFNSSHLAEMLGHFRHVIECVVLNACHSEAQLAEIARHVPAILGTNASLDDRAAVLFARSFYDSLANGENIHGRGWRFSAMMEA
jgi:hypothetical protein